MGQKKLLPARGIVCWLQDMEPGQVQLTMDDVERSSEGETWTKRVIFRTSKYDAKGFFEVELTEADLADIGLWLVARLAALSGRNR